MKRNGQAEQSARPEKHFFARAELVMDERGRVDADEGDEGAEVQQFRTFFKT